MRNTPSRATLAAIAGTAAPVAAPAGSPEFQAAHARFRQAQLFVRAADAKRSELDDPDSGPEYEAYLAADSAYAAAAEELAELPCATLAEAADKLRALLAAHSGAYDEAAFERYARTADVPGADLVCLFGDLLRLSSAAAA
jgi:hypothetical protein